MKTVSFRGQVIAALAFISLFSSAAYPHSASNAYLTVTVEPEDRLLHAQWDVALRDLEFVLGLNSKADGKLTWGEVVNRKTDILRYIYAHLTISAGGKPCTIDPRAMQIDDHADGAYVALFFDIHCADQQASVITLDYSLFFDIDPTHRGILVLRNGQDLSTALLAPDNARVQLPLKRQK